MSYIIAEYKFDNILYDLIPEFNEGFEYTYEDILEGNVTTRTIYSNELPTLLRFGNSDTSGETGDSNKYNSLLEVLYLASSEITYAGLMFHRCANVSYICPFILTNKNNSLHGIFSGCHSLTSLDVSNFDTSNVTDMSYAFYTNNLIELDLSDWDTSNVTNMNHILYSCQNLKTLNISNWNLNNVNNMGWFVNQCNNLNEIIMNDSDYNSINKIVSELPITTNGIKCNFCIGGVDDISKVNIREGWDIMNQYKIAEYKFTNSSDLVPVFNEGFTYTYEDVEDGGVTTRTIYGDSLPTMINFAGKTNLLEVYYLETSNLTSAFNLFYSCTGLTYVDLRNSDFSKVETIERMFNTCTNLVAIDGLNDLDISNVDNMGGIFSDCRKLPEINVSNWNVSKVTNFGAVFRRCYELTTIDLSNWDTSNATIMSGIFTNCSKLTEIDLSNWKIDNVTTINQMFYGCSKLTSVKLFNHINSGVNTTYLFTNCKILNKIEIYNSDFNTINSIISVLPEKTSAAPGTLNIKGVDKISQVNLTSALSKNWVIIRDQGVVTNVYAGDKMIFNKLVQNKEIKNIYIGNVKIL